VRLFATPGAGSQADAEQRSRRANRNRSLCAVLLAVVLHRATGGDRPPLRTSSIQAEGFDRGGARRDAEEKEVQVLGLDAGPAAKSDRTDGCPSLS
jgi:hypothetical protein